MKPNYVLQCANGEVHTEHGEAPAVDDYQTARDAADFMDEERDDSPWTCGPHEVVPAANPGEGRTDG